MNFRWGEGLVLERVLWVLPGLPETVLAQTGGDVAVPGLRNLLLLLLFLAAAWLLKRRLRKGVAMLSPRRELKILEVLELTGRQRLILLQKARQRFLLGMGEGGVCLLKEWQEDDGG